MYTTPRGERATAGSAGSSRRQQDGVSARTSCGPPVNGRSRRAAEQITAPPVAAATGILSQARMKRTRQLWGPRCR